MKKISLFFLFSLLVFSLPVQFVKAEERPTVSVAISTMFDEENTVSTTLNSQSYGTKVVYSSSLPGDKTGYEFVCWIVNGIPRSELAQNAEFVVTENLELVGVYHPLDPAQYAVIFMDSNGQVLKVDYVSSGGSATPPSTATLSKPGYAVDDETPWSVGYANVTDDLIVTLQYEIDTTNYYTVHEIDEAVETSQNNLLFNAVATVVADQTPASEYFNYWTNAAGKIVSYEASYSFTVVENTTLTANYSDTANSNLPYVTLGNKLSLHDGKSSYIGQLHIPSGYSLVEFGLLTKASTSSFGLGDEGTTKYPGNKYNPTTKEFLISIPSAADTYVKAYLVVENESEILEYKYSSVEMLALSELFFSEYGEGSSNNKWIEIYNPTSLSVDLSQYSVEYFGNGANTPTSISISGTLASGDVFVIANTSANATIISETNMTSSTLAFNGDDAFALYKGEVLIDTFGIIGQDPGSVWTFGSVLTVDKTLVRKVGVSSPSTSWNPYEWDIYNIDTTAYLGYHEHVSPTDLTISGNPNIVVSGTSSLSISSVTPIDAVRSVTWSSSNESVATVSSAGVVTGVATGNVTITATSTVDPEVFETLAMTVNDYTVSASSSDEAKGTVSLSASTVLSGGSVTVYISELEGYDVSNISYGVSSIDLDPETTSYLIENITQDLTVLVTFVVEEGASLTEQVIYTTGFESSESFVAGTTYNNTTISYKGPSGSQWGTYYGTPSTTAPITGLQSMQMRWYTTAPANLGYTFTNFTLLAATKVTFNAKQYLSTNGVNVQVSYSTDDGSTWVGAQTFTLSTTSGPFTYNISETGVDVMLKFAIILQATAPSGTDRLTIDDIVVYGMRP